LALFGKFLLGIIVLVIAIAVIIGIILDIEDWMDNE
jgi:hypothetical protein